MPSVKIGAECKLYYNSASYASPTWVVIPDVRDLSVPDAVGEADASSRASLVAKSVRGLRKVSIEFELLYNSSSTAFDFIRDAYLSRTNVDLLVCNGDRTVAGTDTLRMQVAIFKFDDSQPLEDTQKASVVMMPTLSDNSLEITAATVSA